MLSYDFSRSVVRLLGGVAAMGAFALAASTANAAIITVTTDLDGINNDGECSLREAIQAANTNTDVDGCSGTNVSGSYGADTIVFSSTISVITLTIQTPSGIDNDNNDYLDLDVVVDSDTTTVFTLTIDGGPNGVTVQGTPGSWQDRVFDILTPTVPGAVAGGVLLRNLNIKFGGPITSTSETGAGICFLGGGGVRHRSGGLLQVDFGTAERNRADGNGGGICQDGGQLRVSNYTFIAENSSLDSNGGGVYISGTAEITATVTRNDVEDDGGGIYVASGSVVTITNSDVFTNTAANGGGIYNAGRLTIRGGRVLTNTASANGGGIWNSGLLSMDTEVRANEAITDGGGIWNSGLLNIIGNVVHRNQARSGGGVFNNAGSATISNAGVNTNIANTHGGGIWNSGQLTITQAGLRANVAAGLGGGIFNAPNGQTLVSSAGIGEPGAGNRAQKGGGVYNAISATLTITSAGVHSNTAIAEGGGVYNESGGAVSISNSGVGSNAANSAQNGGGIWNGGALTLTSATVANNIAFQNGGGVFNAGGGHATISGVAIRANQSSNGGGLYNAGHLRAFSAQVESNTAAQGGGLYNDASSPGSGMVITNSAIVSNNQGGAYHLTGTLVITNSTLSGNTGGGLRADDGNAQLWFVTVASNTTGNGISVTASASVQVYATLLAYNTSTNCAGTVTDNGYSMSSDSSCSGFAFTNVDPKLKPLAPNSGGTLNHALALGSPAVDRVPASACPVTLDQRFFGRPWWWTNRCDIGAFELQPYYPVFVPIVFRP